MSIVAIPPQLASANAVLFGRYGDVTRLAQQRGVCRQTLHRDTHALLDTLDGAVPRHRLEEVRQRFDELQARCQELQARLRDAYVIDADRQAEYASTAQAEGVSLPVARRLLAPLLARPLTPAAHAKRRLPSVARLGRLSRAAARKAAALLPVLDEVSRGRVAQAAADEIFFGKKPCLMVVEQHSLCWVSGRLADRRTGEEWAREFRQLPHLRQTTQDGGTALAKGLDLVNQERHKKGQAPAVAQDDHFHVFREGTQALRRMQGGVSKLMDRAEAAQRKVAQKARRTGDRRGQGTVGQTWRRAERALDAWSAAEVAWAEVREALQLFTPEGALNTPAQARAGIAAALPRLTGPAWSKVRRLMQRPQLLTFLEEAQAGLSSLPVDGELLAAAVRVEGLRRRPEGLRGETVSARALRGVLLAAGLVLSLSGEAGSQAATRVRGALRGVWRASSLVECINSVARMQQGRHRKMTQGLLDLKRLYWNCRPFRTGHRRRHTPYELLGVRLPTADWWALLQLTPEQLRQQLSEANQRAAAGPTQQPSEPGVAA